MQFISFDGGSKEQRQRNAHLAKSHAAKVLNERKRRNNAAAAASGSATMRGSLSVEKVTVLPVAQRTLAPTSARVPHALRLISPTVQVSRRSCQADSSRDEDDTDVSDGKNAQLVPWLPDNAYPPMTGHRWWAVSTLCPCGKTLRPHCRTGSPSRRLPWLAPSPKCLVLLRPRRLIIHQTQL